jgi:hypothetical protein
MNSPSEFDLRAFVSDRERAVRATTNLDETNTKTKLIEPVFDLIGWNVSTPQENGHVEMEYHLMDGGSRKKVDYAFLTDRPEAFVEAKSYKAGLTPGDREQLWEYMRIDGVPWGLLTDGDTFEVYKSVVTNGRPD